MYKLLTFALFVLSIYSCSDKVENPAIYVNPADPEITADTGQIIRYAISGNPYKDHTLQRFVMKTYTTTTTKKTIIDSILNNTKSFKTEYEYRVPNTITDTTVIFFEFSLTDEAGNNSNIGSRIFVPVKYESDKLLEELSGNKLYSDPAFNTTSFNLLACAIEANDSTKMHIHADFDKLNANSLTLKWTSPAKISFVQYNGLDYAHATAIKLRNAYNTGSEKAFLANIAEGDIFVAKVPDGGNSVYAAIKVTKINDVAGSKDDYYEFSVKK